MDPDVEPCDDFYNYACGKFVKETVIPDEKVSVNTFSVIGDRLQQQLRALVSDEISESEATPFKLAKNLYKLCMNKSMSEAMTLAQRSFLRSSLNDTFSFSPSTARIEEKGIKPLLDILDNLGGWPVLKGQDWDLDSSWSWVKSVKDFRKNGYSTDYFFDFSIGSDLKNSTRRIIDVSKMPERS